MKKAREADERSAQKLIQTRLVQNASLRSMLFFSDIFQTGDSIPNFNCRDEIEEVSIDLQDHEPKGAIRLLKFHLTNLSGIPCGLSFFYLAHLFLD